MSSDEENRFENNVEIEEHNSENEEVSHVESSDKLDEISPQLDVKFDAEDSDILEQNSGSNDHEGKIGTEELPYSGNTQSFKSKFESEPSEEERRTERRRERRRRRRLTEEEDGPSEGTAKNTATRFEKGEIDDFHFHKTDTSHDSMAKSGTVVNTTEKFRSGKYHSESDEENKKQSKNDDLGSVESGTAAARRKALEEYAEEAKKSHTTSPKALEEDAPVLKRGKAANTRAKLERMSSEEKVLEKAIDVNTPKTGTALERRAKFEEKARQASVEEAPRQTTRTARRSKWPEPNTNYRQRRGELRKSQSVSTDEEGGVSVEKENAKNIEKSVEQADEHTGNEEDAKPAGTSSDESPKSPVKTAEIRNKFVKMLSSEDERSSSPPADLGNARPTAGTARNLRARFEGDKQTEESHFHSKKPSITSRSGYASRVREKFESGEAARRRSSVADEEEGAATTDTAEVRRRRTSSTRSIEQETSGMSRSAKELRSRFENPSQNTQVVKRNFVLRPKASTANISSKFNKAAPAVSKCTECTKTVYPMEMITADNKPFHRKCFKCTECKATLRLGNYAALQGQIYCKPHFKQLFKKKGNYDEGFGREQHKKHWEEKGKQTSDEQKQPEDNKVDSNANIKAPDNDSPPHENGYDHPPAEQTNGYEETPAEHTNGYDSHEDAFISDDGIVA